MAYPWFRGSTDRGRDAGGGGVEHHEEVRRPFGRIATNPPPSKERAVEARHSRMELATRWKVPESWIRTRTRQRTPRAERIPCVRLGRYVRFEWGSPRLEEWLARQR